MIARDYVKREVKVIYSVKMQSGKNMPSAKIAGVLRRNISRRRIDR